MTPTRKPMVMKAIRVSGDLWQSAKVKADSRGESLSDVIRKYLERYVSRP